MLIPALLAAGLGGGALAARRLITRRAERDVASRLPRGADGIVQGAEPILLAGTGPHAVLLVHGLGDSPQTLGYLAADLHARGWTVRAPLLPGHGRTLAAFARSGAEQWIAAVRTEYAALRQRHARVGLVGLSMGGALSVILAEELGDLPALVLLSPYLGVPAAVRWIARVRWAVEPVIPYVWGRGERSVRDERERPKSRAYGYFTAGVLRELARVADQASDALPGVRAPTLLIQSREDNRVAPEVAERAYATLGAREKRLEWIEGSSHVITVDFGREHVFAMTAEWLEQRMAAPARAPRA